MTRYPPPSSCLSPETLALLSAGRLSADERAAAEAHLATCEDCREIVMDLAESSAAAIEAPPVSQLARRTGRPVRARAIIVWSAIAASLVLAAVVAPRYLGGPDRAVTNAVGTLAQSLGSERPAVGRLNGGFEWGAAPVITRGTATTELPLAVQDAVLSIKKLAAANKTAKAMDAVGVANLVAGDIEGSLAAFDEAVALDPKDAGVRSDLAAARFEKWRRTQAPVDATAALDAAQYALLLSPNDPLARFNHALAVEALGLTQAAKDSWNAYLTLDAKSKWAAEAREHLSKLGDGTAGGLPATETGRDRYLPDLAAAIAASSGDPKRLACLAHGRQSIIDSRAAFDASRTEDAERLARTARADFICGGMPAYEADGQTVWTQYFLGRLVDTPALGELVSAAETHGYLRAAGRVLYARGRLAGNAARYSDAQDYFTHALKLFEQAGDTELIASASLQMTEITNAFGDVAGSWMLLSTALRAMPALAPRRQLMTLDNASLTASKFGQDAASLFFADALIDAFRNRTVDPTLLASAYLQGARAALRFGEPAMARARLDRTTTESAAIPDAALREQFTAEINEVGGELLAQTDPRKSVVALSTAMEIFGRAGRPLRRAKLLLIRGRAYRAAGDRAAAEKDWADGAEIFEDQRPEIRDAQQRIDHFDQLWDLFRELIAARASDPVASLEVAERFRGRALLDSLSADRQLTPLSGEAMYRWLPHGVTLIAYAVLPTQLFRWTIARDGVRLDRIEVAAPELNALVDRYRSSLHARGDGLDADARRLAGWLLPALDPRTTTRVIFLPDGALFGVPFAALPLPGPGNATRLLVDDFVPSVAPSLTVLKDSARRLETTRALLVAAGEANAAEALPALPGAAAEVAAIASVYRHQTTLAGAGATRAALLRALPTADIVHFAGHAIADSADPSRSRLLVAPANGASAVTFDDLRRTRLRPGAIVVLSACDAARGPVFHGEGAVGLSYPFLANGASAVVASLWQIDDQSPARLWQSFHARVSVGAPPDAALAESQRVSRHAGVPPVDWAAFESVGGLARQ